MSPATKQRGARRSSASFTVKIGYPTKWRDYSALRVVPGDLFGNAERARPLRVGLSPQPAGQAGRQDRVGHDPADGQRLLQPRQERDRLPGRHPAAALLRSEGRHGGQLRRHRRRDRPRDQPRLRRPGPQVRRQRACFATGGRPRTPRKFEAQANRLGAQYEAYTFADLPNMHINGKATMGENIADLGGILIALDAYHASLNGKPAPVIGGFTGDQRFFLGWGQVWRTMQRTEALRQQLVSDPHSPGQVRAIAPLAQRRRLVRGLGHQARRPALRRARGPRPDLVGPGGQGEPRDGNSPLLFTPAVATRCARASPAGCTSRRPA